MKNANKIETLENMKTIAIKLYEIYMEQSNQNKIETECFHENEHDNSGGHPDFHNNSHDNTPDRMMTRILIKNATN